jgi:hypothetical protein
VNFGSTVSRSASCGAVRWSAGIQFSCPRCSQYPCVCMGYVCRQDVSIPSERGLLHFFHAQLCGLYVMSVDLGQKHLLYVPGVCTVLYIANSAELGAGLTILRFDSTSPKRDGENWRVFGAHRVHKCKCKRASQREC